MTQGLDHPEKSSLRSVAEQAAKAATLKAVLGVIFSQLGLLIAIIFLALLMAFGVIMFAAEEDAQANCDTPPAGAPPVGGTFTTCEPSQEAASDIPPEYLDAYRQAGQEYDLDWTLVAAIGKQESDHGRAEPGCETGPPTPYGTAYGPMQFLESTWASVGVDGNGDGQKDPCDYADAIPAAAGYLVDLGAREDPHGALCSYFGACGDSNADYANEVLAQAERYCGAPVGDAEPGDSSGSSPASATASARPSTDPSASGSGQPPQGWDLVDENRNLHYEIESKYGAYFEDAARDWNLGGVNIAPSPSPRETDLVVRDGELNGAMARANSGGELIYDVSIMDGSSENAKDAVSDHEVGHTLGFEHTEEESVMRTPIITNGDNNFSEPTDYDKRLYYDTWGDVSGSGGDSGGVEGGSHDEAGAVFPLPEEYTGSYSNDWGASRPQGGHEGTDIMAPKGTPIYSITDGIVRETAGSSPSHWSETGGYNIMVEATSDIGPVKAGDLLYYAHMEPPGPRVEVGQKISAGEAIGSVGDTGYGPEVTTGQFPPHLHLGWYDMTGARAEAPSGAMNPYPLLEWLAQNGGEATAVSPLPANCEGGGSSGGEIEGGETGGGGPVKGSGTGKQVVEEARKYLGTPYVLAGPEGCIPGEEMDCTCLTTTVFREFGFDGPDALPDDPGMVVDYGEPVERGDVKAGDIYVYGDPGDGTGGHVAIAVGDGSIIHANMATMDTSITGCPECAGEIIAIRRLIE